MRRNFKLLGLGLPIACLFVGSACAADGWITTANTEVRYFSSTSSNGANATQWSAPFAVQVVDRPSADWKVSLTARSGYLFASQSSGTTSSTVRILTDSSLNPTVTYLGWNGITPTLSVPMNLPTASGSASASGANSTAKTDADLAPSPTFGEGFNVGPTLSANVNLSESVVLGLGVGHTYRGSFDQGTVTAVSKFDPGDVTTFNATLGYRGDRLSLQGTASYSLESVTTQDGIALYRAGGRLMLGAKAGYAWTDQWSTRFNINYSHFEKNDVQVVAGLPGLVREAFNSNSDVVKTSVEATYSRGAYSIGPAVSYLYRNRNGYDPSTFQFLPAKSAWGIGLNGSYQWSRAFSLTASLQRQWVRENESPIKLDLFNAIIPGSGIPSYSTDVWTASIGGSYKF